MNLGTNNFFALIAIVALLTSCTEQKKKNISEADEHIYRDVEKVLSQMTFEEKIGQMSQRVVFEVNEEVKQDIRDGKIGSILVTTQSGFNASIKNELQKIAVEESRMGIPIIFGHDVIHGHQTIFPTCLAQSCTWDTALVKEGAAIAAKEASATGIDWTFAPMVDVSRDARWGRIAECFGEDPYLNGCFGAASVKGFQGDNVANEERLVSCLKHFVGYGAAMGGRDYQYTDISDRSMNEVYLPPFKAAIDAGALTVMTAFNDINGVPATANKKLLTSVLKESWGFPGFAVSDWDAAEQLLYHGFAKDSIDAVKKAFNAGTDMEMKSGIAYQLKPNDISEKVLDNAVRRLLYVKFRKGLFEKPYTKEDRAANSILTLEHRQKARKVAAESMVLLENKNQILPIKNERITISVVGPFAKEQKIMGWWKSYGNTRDVITAFQGLKNNAPSEVIVVDEITNSTDIIIACVGEKHNTFGENNCRSDINLPGDQSDWIKQLRKYKKPIVTVVFNGRPLALKSEKENSEALLLAWHPGTEGGNALADIIYGLINPSGKLTTSFPAKTGHIPVFYNQRNSGRPEKNTYKQESSEPLYPFGYGISYTSFSYSDLNIAEKQINADGTVKVSANITNTGTRAGTEVVQLYIQDLVGTTTRPIKELKGFVKLYLKAGETQKVNFELPAFELAVLNQDFEPMIENGKFKIWIAASSKGGLEETFEIK